TRATSSRAQPTTSLTYTSRQRLPASRPPVARSGAANREDVHQRPCGMVCRQVGSSGGAYLVRGVSELYTPFERIRGAAFVVDGDRFAWVGREDDVPPEYADLPPVQLGGRGVLPGLVDCHTHLVWDGSRVDEYVARSRGADYEEVLAAGGGIHATVAATRQASEERLLHQARSRARSFVRGGVTTLEVKSGYGLTTE